MVVMIGQLAVVLNWCHHTWPSSNDYDGYDHWSLGGGEKSYLAMMGVLGLSTLSARANGKLGMTTVIEAGKKICNCCNALLSQVCETIVQNLCSLNRTR